MKGNLIRFCKKSVLACIMVAAITFSATKDIYVSAEGVTGDNPVIVEAGQDVTSGGDSSEGSENPSDSTIQDDNNNDEAAPVADEAPQQEQDVASAPADDVVQPEGRDDTASDSPEATLGSTDPVVDNAEPAQAAAPASESAEPAAQSAEASPEVPEAAPESVQPAAEGTDSATENALPAPEGTEAAPEDVKPVAEKNEADTIASSLSVTGTAEGTFTYDGESHETGVLLSSTSITVDGSTVSVVPASDAEGKTFYIAGISGNHVSVNATNVTDKTFEVALSGVTVYDSTYQVTTTPGTMTVSTGSIISPKEVKLESMSVVKPYDGTPLTNGDMPLAVEDGWVGNQGAYYTFTKSRTAIGTDVNEFVISSYKEGTIPENYKINYTYGGLTVVDRTEEQKYILTIEGANSTVKYDGKDHSISGYTLEGRSNSEYKVTGDGDAAQVVSFTIGNASFTATGITASGSGKNAGEYPVYVSGSPVIRDAEGNDVSVQFRFEFRPGKLTIEKRSVILTSASLKTKHDGKTHKKHKVTVSGDGFAEGEGATYTFSGKQKDVGESYNYFNYKLNDGTLEQNYEIEKVPGVLKVTKSDTAKNESSKSDNDGSSDSGDSSSGTQTPSDTQASTTPPASGQPTAAPAGTANDNPNVLGAKRGDGGVTVDIANPAEDNVLGARRSSTDDYTDLGRHIIVFAAAILFMTILTIRKDKRIKK